MLSLYFNTKITGKSSNRNTGKYFYPVTYPDSDGSMDPIDVLVYTINSYSSVEFDQAFFNIDLGLSNPETQGAIESVIMASISALKLHISFSRPSNLNEWKSSVAKVSEIIGENGVLLVAMNHDHPFVDYTPIPFRELTNQIFSKNSYKKVLYYSHAPELMSWALNGKDRRVYENIGNFVYQSSIIDNWLDSFCLMTSKTLLHILESAIQYDSYMGRVDWPGMKYRNLDLTAFIYPREFFKHFDGYGHVTGLRLISTAKSVKGLTPRIMDLHRQCDFYYQKWIDVSILAIKDRLAKANNSQLKKYYISYVDDLFNIFKVCYLEVDKNLGIISAEHYEALIKSVYDRIYLESNDLIMQINIDNILQNRVERWSITSIVPLRLKRIMKNFLGM
jgi:hypothetical protein